jgi:hypothetical protein
MIIDQGGPRMGKPSILFYIAAALALAQTLAAKPPIHIDGIDRVRH